MKKILRVACVGIAVALASCSDGLSGLGLTGSGGGGVLSAFAPPRDFYAVLAAEYDALALYEDAYAGSLRNGPHFREKAQAAARRRTVPPDRPDRTALPAFAAQELDDARRMLVAALTAHNGGASAALLAMAQTRYDCWLAHRRAFPEKGAWLPCRAQFYDSLAQVETEEKEESVHSIHFDSGSTVLDEAARRTIEDVAARYAERAGWDVVLKGYTDRVGNRARNKTLALRRAVAVKHSLAQYGIDFDRIAVSAEGETPDDGSADDRARRRVDIVLRPPAVAGDKGDLTAAPGWVHTGEF